MPARSHKDLVVWQKSVDLVEKVYVLTRAFPQTEIYGLSSQMRRAAISIPSNISEGRNRGSHKDYRHFLRVAYGSAAELDTQLLISKRLNFCTHEEADSIGALIIEVEKMLHVMIERLGAPRS